MRAQRRRSIVGRSRNARGCRIVSESPRDFRTRLSRFRRCQIQIAGRHDLCDHEGAFFAVARSFGQLLFRRIAPSAGKSVAGSIERRRRVFARLRMSLATAAMRNVLGRHGWSRILGDDDSVLVMIAAAEDGVPKHGPRCHQTHQSAHRSTAQKDVIYSLCIGIRASRQYDKKRENPPI